MTCCAVSTEKYVHKWKPLVQGWVLFLNQKQALRLDLEEINVKIETDRLDSDEVVLFGCLVLRDDDTILQKQALRFLGDTLGLLLFATFIPATRSHLRSLQM